MSEKNGRPPSDWEAADAFIRRLLEEKFDGVEAEEIEAHPYFSSHLEDVRLEQLKSLFLVLEEYLASLRSRERTPFWDLSTSFEDRDAWLRFTGEQEKNNKIARLERFKLDFEKIVNDRLAQFFKHTQRNLKMSNPELGAVRQNCGKNALLVLAAGWLKEQERGEA